MVRFHWPYNSFKEISSDVLSNLHVCNICPLLVARCKKKVKEIRRERLIEHVPDVNCYSLHPNLKVILRILESQSISNLFNIIEKIEKFITSNRYYYGNITNEEPNDTWMVS